MAKAFQFYRNGAATGAAGPSRTLDAADIGAARLGGRLQYRVEVTYAGKRVAKLISLAAGIDVQRTAAMSSTSDFSAAGTTIKLWEITDNGNGTFSIISSPLASGALQFTDNEDGTFNVS